MDGEHNSLALRLIASVTRGHPEWQQYAAPYGPMDDAEAEPGSVIFAIPAPREPDHRLEIAQRGNTIEVAYDCGEPGVRAEQQFVFANGEFEEALEALQEFVHQLFSGQVIIIREPLGRIVRAIRRDGVSERAFFRPATGGDTLEPATVVHRWNHA